MSELISVGLDVGTTTTQLIVSKLTVENKAGSFSVPELEIANREILYKSPVHFTPLLSESLVDGDKIRDLVAEEYGKAGITKPDTGAIIITGETARKENAAAVLQSLSDFAGDFVVATAGPDLESLLAAQGAGALEYSRKTGKKVLHLDIGGGTSNLALINDGQVVKTGCLNVGGRLIKVEDGSVCYVSPVLQRLPQLPVKSNGRLPHQPADWFARTDYWPELAEFLVEILEMAAGLREKTEIFSHFVTEGSSAEGLEGAEVFSFSGGVADCIDTDHPPLAFGDLGVFLGRAIAKSRLQPRRLGAETIRATVIGAGCHAAQLSGSTVYYRGIRFPLKSLPVIALDVTAQESPHLTDMIRSGLAIRDRPGVVALPGYAAPSYRQITALADRLLPAFGEGPIYLAVENDMAKALGQALALRTQAPILCIDRVKLSPESYLDVGAPVGPALPVVIKTLILKEELCS